MTPLGHVLRSLTWVPMLALLGVAAVVVVVGEVADGMDVRVVRALCACLVAAALAAADDPAEGLLVPLPIGPGPRRAARQVAPVAVALLVTAGLVVWVDDRGTWLGFAGLAGLGMAVGHLAHRWSGAPTAWVASLAPVLVGADAVTTGEWGEWWHSRPGLWVTAAAVLATVGVEWPNVTSRRDA